MKNNYQKIRSEYRNGKLCEDSVSADPFAQFDQWMNEAIHSGILHPTSMMLASAGSDGQPSARIVLLKNVTDEGFIFFTNYHSRKGQQLAENPKVAMTFFWTELERQVRIEGTAEKVSPNESEAYFNSRPFESRLSAAISPQSKVVENRDQLVAAMETLRSQVKEEHVPRPEHWGGFLVRPHRIEFWQGRESRLHDRIEYFRSGKNWKIQRLAP